MARRNKNEPLPYYKWLWRDWRSNRRVQRMSWQAKGLYRELLDEFWAEGVLPASHEELADICACDLEEFDLYWPEIEPCFEETPDGYINRKMDEQRTETDAIRAANARNGQAGAIAKLATASERVATVDDRQATASDRHIAEQSRAKQSKAEKRSTPRAVSRAQCEIVYDAYPRKVAKDDALKAIGKAIGRLIAEKGGEIKDAVEFLRCRAETFARSPAGMAGNFTPHPASWFNKGRYLDNDSEWQNEQGDGHGTNRSRGQASTNSALAALARADAADGGIGTEEDDPQVAGGDGGVPRGGFQRRGPIGLLEGLG